MQFCKNCFGLPFVFTQGDDEGRGCPGSQLPLKVPALSGGLRLCGEEQAVGPLRRSKTEQMGVSDWEGPEAESSTLDGDGDGLRRMLHDGANDGSSLTVDGIDDERYLETIVEGRAIYGSIGEVSQAVFGRTVT